MTVEEQIRCIEDAVKQAADGLPAATFRVGVVPGTIPQAFEVQVERPSGVRIARFLVGSPMVEDAPVLERWAAQVVGGIPNG